MERFDISQMPVRTLYDGDQMPAIGLGTFGSDKYDSDTVAQAVYGAVKYGYRLIDCASVYENEAMIGGVLQKLFDDGVVARKELFITSKVWNDQHREVERACRKSLADLRLDYLDLYMVHWPFPNYHAPHCDGDSRNPDSKPFSADEFMDTWHQMERLVEQGLVRHIGMSNMTIPKLEAVLPLCRVQPAACEMECHPAFQQPELYQYLTEHHIQPIGFCPLGSPSRPERDRTAEDVAATQMPAILDIAARHGVHPAIVCLKWAVQRGLIPIPFSVKEAQYIDNLNSCMGEPLTDEEMESIRQADCNCRLIKGQVFLWPGAEDWRALWDLDGMISG